MKRYDLAGITATNKPARIAADVVGFVNHSDYFNVHAVSKDSLQLSTPKGSYTLLKHATLNIYQGTCNGRKVHVSLKKIVGELRFW